MEAIKLGSTAIGIKTKEGVVLAVEKRWSYISNLPETYSVPIFFPGEDIKNLQYAPLLHQVKVHLGSTF
ncbi:hypothetical protein ACS0TY_014502 [Phlomoides rotata]